MTRKNRHRGQGFVETNVYWIVYSPGKHEKKHHYAATYFEALGENFSAWGVDKGRAIRFLTRDAAERTFKEATDCWKDRAHVSRFQIVPADEVTT